MGYPRYDGRHPEEPQTTNLCHPRQHSEPTGEGQRASREMVSSGQLVIHPERGAVQGPCYKGPFARWARPLGTPEIDLGVTSLLPDVYKSQFDKNSLEAVGKLEQKLKETVKDVTIIEIDDSDQQLSPSPERNLKGTGRFEERLSKNVEIIDLTIDDPPPLENRQIKQKARVSKTTSYEWAAWWNDGEEWDNEDHYFPPNNLVGANLTLDNA
ncbi:MAG: hypothetical protein Q9160_005190 [Pyrenula sp. 1 TL-2023]